MANRKRNIQMKFWVTAEEKGLIDEKMKLLPTQRYKKIRSTATTTQAVTVLLFLCLEKWRKSTLFPVILNHSKAEDKSYCLCILSLTEPKKSSVFNPFLASFLPYLSGREDRQLFWPGNSACSYGYIFCRSCCTAACRSPQERSSIPVSTFYFGS